MPTEQEPTVPEDDPEDDAEEVHREEEEAWEKIKREELKEKKPAPATSEMVTPSKD